MDITIKLEGEPDQNFELKDAFAKDDGEIVVIGKHKQHDRLEAMGLKFIRDNAYFYPIKYQTQKIYKNALKLQVGEEVELKSDRPQMLWEPATFKKVDVAGIKKLLSLYDHHLAALKSPDGLLVPGDEDKIYIGDKQLDVRKWNALEE